MAEDNKFLNLRGLTHLKEKLDNRYVNVTGDTMTGALKLTNSTGYIQLNPGQILIRSDTTNDISHSSTNPRISFNEKEGVDNQQVSIIYTDYNETNDGNYGTAGLKIVGDGGSGSPAWFAVEGSCHASSFIKSGESNAANKVLMADGSAKLLTSVTGNYLPLSGGTMTGLLELKSGLNVYNTSKYDSTGVHPDHPLSIYRGEHEGEKATHWIDDGIYHIEYTNDEAASQIDLKIINNDTEGSDGSNAHSNTFTFDHNGYLYANQFRTHTHDGKHILMDDGTRKSLSEIAGGYWANIKVQSESKTDTEPTFSKVTIKYPNFNYEDPALRVNYYEEMPLSTISLGLIKMGPPSMDNYIGIIDKDHTWSGRPQFVMHTTHDKDRAHGICDFGWFSTDVTQLMQLRSDSGELQVKSNVIAPTFVGKIGSMNGRIESADISHSYDNNRIGLQLDISSTSMKTNKPGHDGYINTFKWDNNGAYDTQLFIPNNDDTGSGNLKIRFRRGSNWNNDWRDIPNEESCIMVNKGQAMATNRAGYWACMTNSSQNSNANTPGGGWWHILSMDWATGESPMHWLSQLALPTYNNNNVYYRKSKDGHDINDSSWIRLLDVNDNGNIQGKADLIQSKRDFSNGTLVQTSIPSGGASGDAFYVEITGNSYNNLHPYDIKLQGYLWDNKIINYSGIAGCKEKFDIKVFNYRGYLALWWPRVAYWQGFNVGVYAVTEAGSMTNKVTSITDEGMPNSEVSKTITISPDFIGDDIYVKKSGDTMSGTLTLASDRYVENGTSGMNCSNSDITNINSLHIADPGPTEGIFWDGGNGWKIVECPDNLSNTSGNLQFMTGGTRRLTLDTSGSLHASNYYAPSDKRLKTNIIHTSINDYYNILNRINLYEFNWKDENKYQGKNFGTIAQELEQIVPEHLKRFFVNEDDTEDHYLSINDGKLVYLTIGALQEQLKINEELKTKNNELENRLVRLEKILGVA